MMLAGLAGMGGAAGGGAAMGDTGAHGWANGRPSPPSIMPCGQCEP